MDLVFYRQYRINIDFTLYRITVYSWYRVNSKTVRLAAVSIELVHHLNKEKFQQHKLCKVCIESRSSTLSI